MLVNSGSLGQISFGSNVDASHECGSQSETSIAINPASTDNVIAGSNEIQRLPMRAMYSTDGGTTFTGVDLPLPPPRTNNGFDFGSDPGIAFDSNGNAYYSYIVVFFSTGGAINGTEMAVAHSSDGGATWTATFFNPQTGNSQFNDKPMITVDTGSAHHNRVYVAWDNATGNSSSNKNGNNVLLSHSDDGGVTFSTPVSVSGPFTGRTGGIGADPYVTANGTVHVAWQDYAHGTIADAASTDGGQTFSPPHVIAAVNAFAVQRGRAGLARRARLSIVRLLRDGALLLVHQRQRRGDQRLCGEVDRRRRQLGVDPGAGRRRPVQPMAGRRSLERLRERGLLRHRHARRGPTLYTLARSTDGGSTYSAAAVANAPTDESCCSPSVDLGNQYGDYEGIAAYGGMVRPVWTDRRQAVIDLGLREEVFTATLRP